MQAAKLRFGEDTAEISAMKQAPDSPISHSLYVMRSSAAQPLTSGASCTSSLAWEVWVYRTYVWVIKPPSQDSWDLDPSPLYLTHSPGHANR